MKTGRSFFARLFAAVLSVVIIAAPLAGCGDSDDYGDDTTTSAVTSDTSGTSSEQPSSDPAVVLSAEDAVLSDTQGIIIEPDSPPYNIGGWSSGKSVGWEFDLEQSGRYTIGMVYARPYVDSDVYGTIWLYSGDAANPQEIEFSLDITSQTPEDWSVYEYRSVGSVDIEAGECYLSLAPGNDTQYIAADGYFVNLRSVQLFYEGEPSGELSDPSDDPSGEPSFEYFIGIWCSYSDNLIFDIAGETAVIVDLARGTEYDAVCSFTDEGLKISSEKYIYTLYLLPDGTPADRLLGHLRWIGSRDPGESPMDYSDNSYLGEWFCEELGSTIELRWDFTMSLNSPNGVNWGVRYEPYDNILVTFLRQDGDDKIFRGADAEYDPDAQTLTVGEGYVYTRLSYGGGKKPATIDILRYDSMDWSSPYSSNRDIAAEIISVWERNGEQLDEKFLDPDQLVEIIDNSQYESEWVFNIACAEAGIDVAEYFGTSN